MNAKVQVQICVGTACHIMGAADLITIEDLVAEPLRSPALTAEWEQQLKEVEEGRRPAAEFYRDIVGFLRELIPQVAQGPALSPEQVAAARERQPGRKGKGRKGGAKPAGLGRCPLCKAGEIVETAKGYGCSRYREGCRLTIWKTVAGRKLTKRQVGHLLRKGRTERIEGFTSKAGKPFAARLKLGEGFKVEFDFGDEPRRGDIPGSAAASGSDAPARPRPPPEPARIPFRPLRPAAPCRPQARKPRSGLPLCAETHARFLRK